MSGVRRCDAVHSIASLRRHEMTHDRMAGQATGLASMIPGRYPLLLCSHAPSLPVPITRADASCQPLAAGSAVGWLEVFGLEARPETLICDLKGILCRDSEWFLSLAVSESWAEVTGCSPVGVDVPPLRGDETAENYAVDWVGSPPALGENRNWLGRLLPVFEHQTLEASEALSS